MQAALPPNEKDRIQALLDLEILDTLPEQAYDDITLLASMIADTPIALVSLVDSERQWFKSRVGLEASETPRDQAFCAHAILEPGELFIVPDARSDERFADNPLVTSEPDIRFYAGAPLSTSDGLALGALCVIDRRPREISLDRQAALRALARQVMAQLDLRVKVRQLKESLAEVKLLRGILPICSYCHQIRTDEESWSRLELYIQQHSDARFSHAICPRCFEEEVWKEKPSASRFGPHP